MRSAPAQIKNTEPLVKFIGVEKSYDGRTLAVRGLTLDVAQGEFLTLLGPSGSGKTTTLNMLAGFERPTRGEILLGGRPVDRLPPYERNIGMVFQNYALFPHMTVGENVAFPLSVRRIPRAKIAERVQRALAMVRLEAFSERRPVQLSGGQQQRVALARALVFEPSLVLMDEPLGALDKKLREQMQIEIKLLHERLGLTVVYVTHDQSEALTMSDRIAVFHDGQVMQQGTPDVLCPASPATPSWRASLARTTCSPAPWRRLPTATCALCSPVAFKCWPRPLGNWIVVHVSLLLSAQRQCASPPTQPGRKTPAARS